MRTTLNLDEDLIQELIKATEARTKTEAIHIAAEETIRRKREKVESERQKKLAKGWRGHR